MAKNKPHQVIITFIRNDRPGVILNVYGNVHCEKSIDDAREFTCREHEAFEGVSSIVIVDMTTGETEML